MEGGKCRTWRQTNAASGGQCCTLGRKVIVMEVGGNVDGNWGATEVGGKRCQNTMGPRMECGRDRRKDSCDVVSHEQNPCGLLAGGHPVCSFLTFRELP